MKESIQWSVYWLSLQWAIARSAAQSLILTTHSHAQSAPKI